MKTINTEILYLPPSNVFHHTFNYTRLKVVKSLYIYIYIYHINPWLLHVLSDLQDLHDHHDISYKIKCFL